MSRFTYKTKDGTESGYVPGYGAIVDGQISSDVEIESPNLELVGGTQPQNAPIVGVASQQNPNLPETAGTEINDKPQDEGSNLA